MRYGDLKTNIHSRKGITLVELVVAMTLTSIFAVLCVMLINPIERTYRGTLKLARAQLLADTVLDSIRKECDDVKHDEKTDVWITNLSGNDDAALFSGAPTEENDKGNTLVFRKNDNYSEAIYSSVSISKSNYEKVLANPVKYRKVDDSDENEQIIDHSIYTLIINKENIPDTISAKGIVHFGYYQSKEDENGILPFRAYDYSDPVLAKTYGNFTVDLEFSDLTRKDGKYPAYVMCKISIKEKDTVVYSRSAVLCFSANGSGKGSGGGSNVDPKVRDIEVKVVWKDNNNFDKRPASGLSFSLNDNSGGSLGTCLLEDVKTKEPQIIVFRNVNTANGWNLSVNTDLSQVYERSIKRNANGFLVTYTLIEEQDEVMLIPGPDFNQLVTNKGITKFVFAEADDAHRAMVSGGQFIANVSCKENGTKTEDYKLYFVNDGTEKYAYVLSSRGTFNGNRDMSTMFYNCNAVTLFTGLDLIDTSNTEDMHRMFMDCRKLTEVHVENWKTAKVKAFDSMFRNVCCEVNDNVKMRIDISGFSFESACYYKDGDGNEYNQVNGINKMFCKDDKVPGISRIDTIVFPSGHKDMSKLERLQDVFRGCSNLVTLTGFNDINFSGLREKGDNVQTKYSYQHYKNAFSNVFASCTNLKEVDLSNWYCPNVTTVDDMLTGATYLMTLDMHRLQIPRCKSVSSMFSKCINLSSVKLYSSDFSSVTSFNSLFSGKANLQSVYMQNCTVYSEGNWTATKLFYNCHNLVEVNLNGFFNGKCTSIESTFEKCSKLLYVDMSSWNTSNVSMKRLFYGSGITRVNFSDVVNATNIESMFESCASITDLSFIDNVTFSSTTTAYKIFADCTGLTNIKVKLVFPKVTSVNRFFIGCTNATVIDLTGSDLSKCQKFELTFSDCSSLTKVIMDESNLSSIQGKVIDSNKDLDMFMNCTNLTELSMQRCNFTSLQKFYFLRSAKRVDLSGATFGQEKYEKGFENTHNESVILNGAHFTKGTTLKQLFLGCSSLVSVNLDNLDAPYVKNCSELLKDCTSLTTFNLDGFNLALNETTEKMLYGCTSLQSVVITNTNLPKCQRTRFMFCGCTNLKSVDISGLSAGSWNDAVSMFKGCSLLETIDVSGLDFTKKVKINAMFNGCASLTRIYVSPEMTYTTSQLYVASVSDETATTVFENCTSLAGVGSDGSVFAYDANDPNCASKDYARMNQTGYPGYFTAKT